ncbi:predicted protein [Postia placenta Mad-698-R]|uniref:Fe2OG dioxygenase domain-containing protein n=1 Tax=Postia placenta MAD-698-R-SB12 TaxID=670580 RepID=A0A1X6MK57_9APHY|nr:hypothetical protein POSPLADRAFT_1050455 [Postia placenta MAD-698-R-SB12]EED80261.1 predicted protein [Postia placenta Mad-698-R]OSX56760.1 hypothetical protein POSPLADRAFT_1050455 [Postia placenta MAD-698-R-SB12]
MPSLTLPSVPRYVPPPLTKESCMYLFSFSITGYTTVVITVEYADLAFIDFSKLGTPEGRAELATQVRDALSVQGFFYVINHGLTQAQNERIFDIGDVPFTQVSDEEKRAYQSKIRETGSYQGYKFRQYWFTVMSMLMAMGMELPEDAFVNVFGWSAEGETWYYVGMTLLWSQPVAALQILSPDGKWRWVKHVENAIVVNAGDAMEFLSGGFYKATIHRVVQPPEDQRGHTRLGLIYFTVPDEDVKLVPFTESPVLRRAGIKRRFEDGDAPMMRDYRIGRASNFLKAKLQKTGNGTEEGTILNGITVTFYD